MTFTKVIATDASAGSITTTTTNRTNFPTRAGRAQEERRVQHGRPLLMGNGNVMVYGASLSASALPSPFFGVSGGVSATYAWPVANLGSGWLDKISPFDAFMMWAKQTACR